MGVSFYNFTELHNDEFKTQIKQRINDIVDKNAFIEGEYNTRFEQRFAQMQKAKHCALVANGTDGLEIALKVAGVKAGDKVGCPGISFFASAEAIITVGAEPVFIDVSPETGLMDPESLIRVTQQHTLKAIMPVHIYGLGAPIKALNKLCEERAIEIIEDAAQGQGGFLEDSPIGGSGHLTVFSFYPTKNLSAFGDAGAILTGDDEENETIRQIRNHGRSAQGHALSGVNSRCDSIQAAVLDLKLEKIEQYNQQRKQVAKWYHERLKEIPVQLMPAQYLETSSWHLYPILTGDGNERIRLQTHLNNNAIGNALFYNKSLPEEKPLMNFKGEKEQARLFAQKALCLPMNPFVTQSQVDEVYNVLKSFYF